MDEPPVVLAVPAVVLTMGYWVPTSITEVSLSRVTVRGEEITFVSAYVLRNDKTAFTPSAFRKKVLGERPRAVALAHSPWTPPGAFPPAPSSFTRMAWRAPCGSSKSRRGAWGG